MEVLMDQGRALTTIVEQWNLLKHPFYQAWSAGTLEVKDLQIYAREYGAFIKTLPQGWLVLDDPDTAEEENEHVEDWNAFTNDLGAETGVPQLPEAISLVQIAQKLFSQPSTALGALYAFEVQQPATAESKLNGLNKWYNINEAGKNYFKLHSKNWHESEKILTQINALSPDKQEIALEACANMSEALWDALSGIHKETCTN
jgi:pyrroloquinoline-quinone synthase